MKHHKTHRRHRSSRKSRKTRSWKSPRFISKGVGSVKSVGKKYIEKVGTKVIQTGEKSVPFLQNMTRKIRGLFSGNV